MKTFTYLLTVTNRKPFSVELPFEFFTLHPQFVEKAMRLSAEFGGVKPKDYSDYQSCFFLDFSNPDTLAKVKECLFQQFTPAVMQDYSRVISADRPKHPFPIKALWWHNRSISPTAQVLPHQLYDHKYSLNTQVAARLEWLVVEAVGETELLHRLNRCPVNYFKFKQFDIHSGTLSHPQFLSLAAPTPII